jgi:hypothetical protein
VNSHGVELVEASGIELAEGAYELSMPAYEFCIV